MCLRPILGTIVRTFVGGMLGASIFALFSLSQGNDPALGILVGGFFGLVVGFVTGGITAWWGIRSEIFFFVVGALTGIGCVLFYNFNNLVQIDYGLLIDETYFSIVVTGAGMGGFIGTVASRRKQKRYRF